MQAAALDWIIEATSIALADFTVSFHLGTFSEYGLACKRPGGDLAHIAGKIGGLGPSQFGAVCSPKAKGS